MNRDEFVKKAREERAKRRLERAQKVMKRDWSILSDYPIWVYSPLNGFFPNLTSQAAVQDMNQDTPSYQSPQNPAHPFFVTEDEADRANRPEIEVAKVDPALQVERLANELKAVVQQADQKGQKVVAVSLRVEFAA